MIEDGDYDRFLVERYAGWDAPEHKAMLAGKASLEEIAGAGGAPEDRRPSRSRDGRNILENLLNRFV